MAGSFILKPECRKQPDHKRRTVLVTGAAGRIGSYFAEHCHTFYDLTLMVHPAEEVARIRSFGRIERALLQNEERMIELCSGVDTVLHLAADPSPNASWASILPNNIVGTHVLFEAALAGGCRRVVFASSIHAVSGYPLGCQVHPDDPVNPGDLYGVSKCFGEALGRYMTTQHGLSCLVIRIGSFLPRAEARREDYIDAMNTFVDQDDLNQLLCCSIDNEDLDYAILHGASNNWFNRMDLTSTRELVGYSPDVDFTEENPTLQKLHLRERVRPHSRTGR